MPYEIVSLANLTMSSKDIAELTGKQHKHVLEDVRKLRDYYAEIYSAEKTAEFVKSSTYADSTGRTLPCFQLSKDASLDLVTGYSLPHRHAVNQRWMELEAQQPKFQLPQTLPEALRALADEVEAHEKTKEALEIAKPKAEYFDALVDRNLLTNFRDTAKELGLKQNEFIQVLVERKFLYRDASSNLKPYAKYTPELFELKEWKSENKTGVQTLITPRGRETFRLLLCK
nr:MAG TPA: KilAC domain protein [Caudoviricetes sp.]